jgi:hypothetical protein
MPQLAGPNQTAELAALDAGGDDVLDQEKFVHILTLGTQPRLVSPRTRICG